jgi:uncharacterized protein YdcH (DUF465 family)
MIQEQNVAQITSEPSEAFIESLTPEVVEDTPTDEGDPLEPQDLSDEVKDKLMNKDSIAKRLEAAKAKKQAEEAQALADQEAEEEAEQESEEEEPNTPVLAIEVNGTKLEGTEAITAHITELATKATEYEEALAEYKQNEAKLIEIVEQVPEFETLIARLSKGDSLRTALIYAGFGPEDFEVTSEDEPDAEAVVQAKLDRKRAIAEAKKAQEEFAKNSAKSEEIIAEFQKEAGFDEKVKEQLVGEMAGFIQDATMGKLSKKHLDIFLKGINYESAVKKAEKIGEVQGLNKQIDLNRKKKSAAGIPVISSGLESSKPAPSNKLGSLIKTPATSFLDMIKK